MGDFFAQQFGCQAALFICGCERQALRGEVFVATDVLLVNAQGKMGGAENSLVLLAKSLRHKYSLAVSCPGDGRLSGCIGSLGVRCLPLPPAVGVGGLSIFWPVDWVVRGVAVSLVSVLSKCRLIHANSFYAAAFAVLPALLMRKRLIWHARDFIRFGLAVRICSRFSARIIAVSSAVRDHLIFQGVDPAKIEVVYNGVETCECSGGGGRVSEAAETAAVVFGNVGQFVPWKKQSLFLEAAAEVARKMPEARFLLVGDNLFSKHGAGYKRELLAVARKLGVFERVVFLGWQADMAEIWRRMDCLVHTADREPFGRVIIEAMSQRIPVIAVNSAGPSEIIEHNHSGILVRADDSRDLAAAMLTMGCDPDMRRRVGERGYRRVVEDFSADKTGEAVTGIYSRVLAGSAG